MKIDKYFYPKKTVYKSLEDCFQEWKTIKQYIKFGRYVDMLKYDGWRIY